MASSCGLIWQPELAPYFSLGGRGAVEATFRQLCPCSRNPFLWIFAC